MTSQRVFAATGSRDGEYHGASELASRRKETGPNFVLSLLASQEREREMVG